MPTKTAVPKLKTIIKLLPEIFPEGISHRQDLISEMTARTIFVMFYTGAIEGRDRWIRPDQVTKMTDRQANRVSATDREYWTRESVAPGKMKTVPERWYSVNTRESIRDESIARLVSVAAAKQKPNVPVTSSTPRYALSQDFAVLFEQPNTRLIRQWQETSLRPEALARIALLKQGISTASGHLLIKLPTGETRRLSPGPSSGLTKMVIEQFTPRFLKEPGLILLSESGKKIVQQDDQLAKSIGLNISVADVLPDIVLVDLGAKTPLIVFIEVVINSGPISEKRKEDLLRSAEKTGFSPKNILFVTAFLDHNSTGFRKFAADIAWGSFAWFAAEPDYIIIMRGGASVQPEFLFELA
jgi:hypothetical protein